MQGFLSSPVFLLCYETLYMITLHMLSVCCNQTFVQYLQEKLHDVLGENVRVRSAIFYNRAAVCLRFNINFYFVLVLLVTRPEPPRVM